MDISSQIVTSVICLSNFLVRLLIYWRAQLTYFICLTIPKLSYIIVSSKFYSLRRKVKKFIDISVYYPGSADMCILSPFTSSLSYTLILTSPFLLLSPAPLNTWSRSFGDSWLGVVFVPPKLGRNCVNSNEFDRPNSNESD